MRRTKAHRRWRGMLGGMLTVAMLAVLAAVPGGSYAASTELFFSEYIEGSSNHKALEIYNGTGAAVDLAAAGYNVQMFFNGNTSAGLTINLIGTVADGDVFVLAHSTADPAILAQADQTSGAGFFNGDDAVVLRKGSVVVDAIGQIGVDPGSQWGSDLTSTADNTLRRKAGIETGDTDGTDAFDPAVEWDGYATNTFDGLGAHSPLPPASDPISASCGGLLTALEGFAASRAVSATDPDGTVTGAAITSAPVAGITLDSFAAAAGTGDTATATLHVADTVAPGSHNVTIEFSNDDAPPQTAACTVAVTVTEVLAIGAVQGPVGAGDNGLTVRSPYAPASGNSAGSTVVAVRGVIYQHIISSATTNGIFLQNTAATADGDPDTSDGIFVFMGGSPTLNVSGGGTYTPQVGDEIVLAGRVSEFFHLTQLSSALQILHVARTGVDLDLEVPAFPANPPDDLAEATRYWERREGMRGQVPAGSVVLNGRNVFGFDAEVWVMPGDHALALRDDPYARRSFRDAHPLDNDPATFDDGNGYRILMGSMGVKWAAGDASVWLSPSRTYDTMANSPVGGVYFAFSKYQIQVEQQPDLIPGPDPAANAPPQAFDRGAEFSIATYNVENLYDYRDDPFDGCDFAGNSGCPGVSPPFNYVPASAAAYEERLGLIAEQIVGDLHAPDLILVQEAEDQDICTVTGGALDCGASDNADGMPDTLQELTLAIAALGGPDYAAAYDRDGADDRGITSAFLYRTDRVELLSAAGDPVLGDSPTVSYRAPGLAYNGDEQNPKALNADLPADVTGDTDGDDVYTRAPQVGRFRQWRNGIGDGLWVDLYAISNHFSSGPDGRVNQRREQAAYNAAIVAALQAADPGVRVVTGGDLNVYPRPDDPFPAPDQSDQLGPLYDQGLLNLFDTVVSEAPVAAYGYVFQGQTQTLDQIFVTPTVFGDLVQARVAHINSDWPAEYDGDGARGISDHDPQAARFRLAASLEGLETLLAFYVDAGAIKGRQTADILWERLARAREFAAAGQDQAAEEQLRTFILQVQGFAPQLISQTVADGLSVYAELLLP